MCNVLRLHILEKAAAEKKSVFYSEAFQYFFEGLPGRKLRKVPEKAPLYFSFKGFGEVGWVGDEYLG